MSTDTSTMTGELTRDDLAALRSADQLSFHHLQPGDNKSGHQIRVYLRDYGERRIYTAREQRLFPGTRGFGERERTIAVQSAVSGYDGMGSWSTAYGGDPLVRAFAMTGATSNPAIRTMLGLLRAGDVITLKWIADNNNQNHTRVGFHADELTLHAGTATGRDLTFRVLSQVGPDNTARMIRRHG